jgi:hypothetical protein
MEGGVNDRSSEPDSQATASVPEKPQPRNAKQINLRQNSNRIDYLSIRHEPTAMEMWQISCRKAPYRIMLEKPLTANVTR